VTTQIDLETSITPTVDTNDGRVAGTARRAVPPLSSRLQVLRTALVLVSVLSVALLAQLLVVSGLQERASQQKAFAELRSELARGTAPLGPSDSNGVMLHAGAPVAYLEIPKIGLHQVVGEGTSAAVLYRGPGHRRDTVLPGQIGTSVIFGRHSLYGGPFGDLTAVRKGDPIVVTTGQGAFTYHVVDVRAAGSAAPAGPRVGSSRLVLETATVSSFEATGVVAVDADLSGTAVGGPSPAVSTAALAPQERALASDLQPPWALVLWLQALIVLSIGLVWAWHRWGRAQAWVVFFPPLLLVGLAAVGEAARLLPNLL